MATAIGHKRKPIKIRLRLGIAEEDACAIRYCGTNSLFNLRLCADRQGIDVLRIHLRK